MGTKAFWELLTDGRSATRRMTLLDPAPFRSQMAAECDFDAAAEGLSPQEIRRMDRAAQFGVVCVREARADSGIELETVPPERVGVSIGSAVGCTTGLEEEYVVLSDGGRKWLLDPEYGMPHLYDFMVPSSIAVEVAREAGAGGPVALISTGCTAGLDAVRPALQLNPQGTAGRGGPGDAPRPPAPHTGAPSRGLQAP